MHAQTAQTPLQMYFMHPQMHAAAALAMRSSLHAKALHRVAVKAANAISVAHDVSHASALLTLT